MELVKNATCALIEISCYCPYGEVNCAATWTTAIHKHCETVSWHSAVVQLFAMLNFHFITRSRSSFCD